VAQKEAIEKKEGIAGNPETVETSPSEPGFNPHLPHYYVETAEGRFGYVSQ